MIKTYKILLSAMLIQLTFSCSAQKVQEQPRITVKGTQFYKGDTPYNYIGTNYWYGALLAAKEGGDRQRLAEELDFMKANGIDNLRVLVGAEGGNQDFTVSPALQPKQGKYDGNLLDGLDYLLAEMGKRNMYAVLYLNNNWEWSGGMAQYLEWNGYGTLPNPNIKPNTWPQFMEYTRQFHKCEPCIEAFNNHIKFILGRTNAYTKEKYTEDPTIMSWQVANEPRVFTADNEAAFTKWLKGVTGLLKNLDKNHLVCTGSEGKAGSADDIAIFERTHDNIDIDYLTMHIWPKNWSWFDHAKAQETLESSIKKTFAYIDEHIAVAKRLGKPIVLEEFGLAREGESLAKQSSVANRNAFYKAIFDRLENSVANKETFAALNFWGFGGIGNNDPANGKWKKGDDFTADPPQEPQGLNSVFSTDTSTFKLIKEYNERIK